MHVCDFDSRYCSEVAVDIGFVLRQSSSTTPILMLPASSAVSSLCTWAAPASPRRGMRARCWPRPGKRWTNFSRICTSWFVQYLVQIVKATRLWSQWLLGCSYYITWFKIPPMRWNSADGTIKLPLSILFYSHLPSWYRINCILKCGRPIVFGIKIKPKGLRECFTMKQQGSYKY